MRGWYSFSSLRISAFFGRGDLKLPSLLPKPKYICNFGNHHAAVSEQTLLSLVTYGTKEFAEKWYFSVDSTLCGCSADGILLFLTSLNEQYFFIIIIYCLFVLIGCGPAYGRASWRWGGRVCMCDRAGWTKGMYLQNTENRSEPSTRLLSSLIMFMMCLWFLFL